MYKRSETFAEGHRNHTVKLIVYGSSLCAMVCSSLFIVWFVAPDRYNEATEETEKGDLRYAEVRPTWRRHYLCEVISGTETKKRPKPIGYEPKAGELCALDNQANLRIFSPHLFGVDQDGKDIFLRSLVSLSVYFFATLIAIPSAFLLGIPLGILGTDLWKGFASHLKYPARGIIDILESMPKYITLFLVIILIPSGIRTIEISDRITWHNFYWLSLFVGILAAPKIAKLLIERIDLFKEREFIQAAETMGISRRHIILTHILRYNCLPPFLVQVPVLIADLVIIEISLNYLREYTNWPISITVHRFPSLGRMLIDGRGYLFDSSWIIIFPLLIALLWTLVNYGFFQELSKYFSRHRISTEL
jgi:peptide/nickel transport system permease protein